MYKIIHEKPPSDITREYYVSFSETCKDIKCLRGKQCRLKKGVPKCVCIIKCTQRQRKSRKICGSDGKTYNNECQLRRRNCKRETSVSMAYRGVCRRKFYFRVQLHDLILCLIVAPISIVLTIDQLLIRSWIYVLGSCKKVRCLNGKRCLEDQNGLPHCVHCRVSCPETSDVQVLCGEDGKTYRNTCELRAAVCRRHKSIRIAYYGECRGKLYQKTSSITLSNVSYWYTCQVSSIITTFFLYDNPL